MSAMHSTIGWAFWSDNLELGTQILGDFLDFGIIAELCLGDAFGAVTLLKTRNPGCVSLFLFAIY